MLGDSFRSLTDFMQRHVFFLCHRYLVLYVEMYIDEQHILLVLSEIYSAKSCCLYNVFYEYFSHFLNDSECYIGARFFVLLSF